MRKLIDILKILIVINVNNMDILRNNVKQISKLEFEKDVINELMEMFDVKQKEIDQVKKKEELKSTNPLKVNKRKKETKRHNNELIDNLPNHLKDKKSLFTKIERIYRHTYCLY